MKNLTENINPNQNYSLVYETPNHNFAQFSISGEELIQQVNDYFSFYMLNEIPLNSETIHHAKNLTSQFAILWASYQKDKTNFKQQVKISEPEYVNAVKKSFKGNQMYKNSVRAHIAVYLYIKLTNRDSSSQNKNTLHVIDYKLTKEEIENYKKTWQRQPATKRHGIRSWKEFYPLIKNGTLKFKFADSPQAVLSAN